MGGGYLSFHNFCYFKGTLELLISVQNHPLKFQNSIPFPYEQRGYVTLKGIGIASFVYVQKNDLKIMVLHFCEYDKKISSSHLDATLIIIK